VQGPSGCGKSTLLHLLGGLVTPTDGEVVLGGRSLASMSDDERAEARRHGVGFVFQAYNLIPLLTVEENVALPARLAGEREREWRPRVAGLLDAMGLADHRTKRPAQLSGGEQQRVAIARAMVMQPAVLLADEPTGNLDPTTSVGIMRLLDRINRTGTTVVMATHDRSIVDTMRRRVVELDRGTIVRDQVRGVYA